ncbi:MAG: hypothetical protein N3G21_05365 [Candidatus Hydrogenedentes bacterium]|nr:hypothetical protein [Candidatus Hydrogenedentota bacterium]
MSIHVKHIGATRNVAVCVGICTKLVEHYPNTALSLGRSIWIVNLMPVIENIFIPSFRRYTVELTPFLILCLAKIYLFICG